MKEVASDYQISRAKESDLDEIARLFRACAAELRVDLGFQDFEKELSGLPGKYAEPEGSILIARDHDGCVVGCVALRPMSDPGYCEVKRLFVEPEHRASGLGRRLARMIVDEGRARGYRAMRLDTLKRLRAALALYESLGFERVSACYDNPLPGVVYMEKSLEPLRA